MGKAQSFKSRIILLSDAIDSDSIKFPIETILEINNYDINCQKTIKDYYIEPIELYINTTGGDAYDALALTDIIEESDTPIYTYGLGRVMSAGMLIYMAGHKRFASKRTTFLYHQVRGDAWGTLNELDIRQKELDRIQKIYDNHIIKNSNIKQKTLDEYVKANIDWYFDAKTALQLKVCHEIL